MKWRNFVNSSCGFNFSKSSFLNEWSVTIDLPLQSCRLLHVLWVWIIIMNVNVPKYNKVNKIKKKKTKIEFWVKNSFLFKEFLAFLFFSHFIRKYFEKFEGCKEKGLVSPEGINLPIIWVQMHQLLSYSCTWRSSSMLLICSLYIFLQNESLKFVLHAILNTTFSLYIFNIYLSIFIKNSP